MFRLACIWIACLLTLSGPGEAFAHGENDEPLYVADDGDDRGRCDDPLEPCRSISYALRFAGKGGRIQVAEGSYRMDNPEDLFHIVSGLVEVSGGYRRGEKFLPSPSGLSVLTGVPHEYRDLLNAKGFHVISDSKQLAGARLDAARRLMALHAELQAGVSGAPCSNGTVSGLACESVDLQSHVAFADVSARPAGSNDVWGFVDLNTHREYAIVGFNSGTGVFDVTDPAAPIEVDFIDGQNAGWRDIKVLQFYDAQDGRWRAYAYVTTDGASDGLFVIDLSGLPHSIRRAGFASDFASAHNLFIANVDSATGVRNSGAAPLLIIAGANLDGGSFRAYELTDPANPRFLARGGGQDYMHDAASLIVSDARKDTQCFGAGATCQVLLDFNESTVDVWDITDAGLPRRLSRTPYVNSGYTHSGWPSEDGQFLFVHDELDEQRFGLATTLRVFSLADLASPTAVGSWTGSTAAIDHNGFVRGNRYYMSNYSRGLTVLDISDPTAPVAAGRLDTYPFSDDASFVGAWGVYPFFWSGSVAISDIGSGLYMAADTTRDVAAGKLSFSTRSVAAAEGQTAQLAVRREGGSTGIASVAYEIIEATADAADYSANTGILSWAAGDASDRTIDINAVNDGVAEGMERLIVRLVSPGGGATLGNDNTAIAYLSDAGAAATVGFFSSAIDVSERGFSTAVVTLQRTGTAVGAVSVDYSMTAGDASPGADFQGPTSGTVTWADGDADPKSLEFAIIDDGLSEPAETFELTLDNAVGATLVAPGVVTVTVNNGDGPNRAPNAIAGASQTRGEGTQVTLDGSRSNDPNGDALTYAWTQTAGPAVSLGNHTAAITSFTAPSVDSDTLLQFELTVTDPSGLSSTAQTTVTVLNGGGSSQDSGGGAAGLTWLLLLTLPLISRRRLAASRRGGA